jgi:alpha-mannosidase
MGHEPAADFLVAWTSQWDPRLIHSMGCLPEWKRADSSSLDLEDALVVCPQSAESQFDQPLRERLELQRCRWHLSAKQSRESLVQQLVQSTAPQLLNAEQPPSLLEDFYALGYAVLQIQVLARKLRYSWNIDWIMFTEQAVSAANAAVANDETETERWLQTCFDSLSQERDRYCSQQAYLLDTVLLASTTLGSTLDKQLSETHPTNFVGNAQLMSTLKERNPSAFSKISDQVHSKRASLIGGLERDYLHPYATSKTALRHLRQGMQAYVRLGLGMPRVFTRYASGFTSSLPTWLTQYGYNGALLNAWSDGSVPSNDQAKVRWQSTSDSSALDTILGHVLDASSADTFIDLAEALSKQLDYHHVPTLVLAHWPSASSLAWSDLMRVIARSPALGKLCTAEDYFTTTTSPYSSDPFPSSAFKIPVPSDLGNQNQLHQRIRMHVAMRLRVERLESLLYLWTQVAGGTKEQWGQMDALLAQTQQLHQKLDCCIDPNSRDAFDSAAMQNALTQFQTLRGELLEHVCQSLSPGKEPSIASSSENHTYLLINPSNHSQRCFLEEVDGHIEKDSSNRILASEWVGDQSRAVIDVPPFGFVRFTAKRGPTRPGAVADASFKPSLWSRISGKRPGIADSDWTLSNEHFEIQIDPKRGHLRSLYVANKRGSLLSGMTSIVQGETAALRRWDDSDCLECTDVQLRLVYTSAIKGVIESQARCKMANGKESIVTTTFTLWRGSRGIEVSIRATNLTPGIAACVWRTAWLNESSIVSAWHHGIKGKLQQPLQANVELIEIDDAEHKVFIAMGGLSAHRKSDSRFLMTQIPVDDSGIANAKLLVGMDWPRPYETAMDWFDQSWLVLDRRFSGPTADAGAWLAQCNLSNIHFYFDDPRPAVDPSLLPADQTDIWTGKQADACVWIQETQGKSGSARLSFFKDVEEAWRVDSQGREFASLPISDGQIVFSVSANEQSRILLRWKRTAGGPHS